MKHDSVWKKEGKCYPRLEGDAEREIVIIGGGIAGYLTAYRLAEAGRNVTLIEADRLFSGTTGKTTAKITANQGNIYSSLYRHYGFAVASLYYNAQCTGMCEYRELVEKFAIDCDFEQTDSYIFSCTSRKKLQDTYNVLKALGAECELTEETKPVKSVCALKMERQYLFDPIRFLSALPVHFEIYEHTRAVNVDPDNGLIQTEYGTVKAEIIIIATHFPILNSRGAYYLKLRQSVSYTIAIEQKNVKSMYLDERADGLSLRPYQGGTLIGGFDHRSGRHKHSGRFRQLKKTAVELFGEGDVTHEWCAQDVMTFDGMPMAGKYSKSLDHVYVITGFNKWGMTNAMVCADVIRDSVLGRKNAFGDVFSPQRRMKGTFVKFLKNACVNVAGIGNGYFKVTFKTAADVPVGCGMIVWHNGKRRAVYRDENNKLYVIGRMCPHMHCELKWNGDAKTWDCPCHGSRFDVYGKILSEPTIKAGKSYEETLS